MSEEQTLFRLQMRSLQLLHKLTVGRHKENIRVLVDISELLGVTFSNLISVVEDAHLPQLLRSAALDLLQSCYLDAPPQVFHRAVG